MEGCMAQIKDFGDKASLPIEPPLSTETSFVQRLTSYAKKMGVVGFYVISAPVTIPVGCVCIGIHGLMNRGNFKKTISGDVQQLYEMHTKLWKWTKNSAQTESQQAINTIALRAIHEGSGEKNAGTPGSSISPQQITASVAASAVAQKATSAVKTKGSAVSPALNISPQPSAAPVPASAVAPAAIPVARAEKSAVSPVPSTSPQLTAALVPASVRPLSTHSPTTQAVHAVDATGSSHMLKMAEHLRLAMERSATPQRYQVLANLLHYYAGVPQENDLLDDSKYHCEWKRFLGFGDLVTEEIPDKFTKLNTNENMLAIVKWAKNVAMKRSLERVIQKFKIQDPKIVDRIKQDLQVLYFEQDNSQKFKEALIDIKQMLIVARIKAKYPSSEADKIEPIVSSFVNNKISLQEAQSRLESMLLSGSASSADKKKIHTILTKFPILRQIDTPEKVSKKIENEVYGVFHEHFAQEIELMNDIQRVEFDGTEILYRGLPASALTREQIVQNFNEVHRAIGALGDISAHQVKTKWSPIQARAKSGDHRGNIASNTTATTLDPAIAIKYSAKDSVGEEGWIFEIRPKAGQTGVSLSSYEERGSTYSEIDLPQIDPKDIKAIHRIRRVGPGKIEVVETLENPVYKKRSNEKTDQSEKGLFSAGVTIATSGDRSNRGVSVEEQNKPTRKFNVALTEPYQRLVSSKVRDDGKLPNKDEIRKNRQRLQNPGAKR